MKKEIYKMKMVEALKRFEKAYSDLVNLFYDADNEANDYICDNYPFEKSFDEIAVSEWVNKTIDNLDKKISNESSSYYLDCDNEVQHYSDWGIEFIEKYKGQTIVKEEDGDRFMIWSPVWNRAFSTLLENNDIAPIYFDELEEVKQYIDKRF